MDEISQREKREIIKDTFFSRAQAEADMVGGRWKKQTETHVTGTPQYPRQPSNSPWHSDPVPPEEPLQIDLEFVGVLGGESPAPVVSASTVETANATDRGGSPTALTDPPLFRRRREW
jgi:hypothetical protein